MRLAEWVWHFLFFVVDLFVCSSLTRAALCPFPFEHLSKSRFSARGITFHSCHEKHVIYWTRVRVVGKIPVMKKVYLSWKSRLVVKLSWKSITILKKSACCKQITCQETAYLLWKNVYLLWKTSTRRGKSLPVLEKVYPVWKKSAHCGKSIPIA